MLQKNLHTRWALSLRQLNCVSVVVLLVLGAIFLIEPAKTGTSFALWPDNEMGYGPVMASISNSLGNLSWPLRMDTFLGGVPLYNYTQFSPFYPGYFFYLQVFNNPLEIINTVHYITLFHFLVLLINTFIFLRTIRVSRLASIVGALSFTFCSNTISYSVWVNMVSTYSWMPLYLSGLIGILSSQQASKKFITYALLGIVFLTAASPSQSLIHAVYISIVFIVFYLLDLKRESNLKLAIRPLAMLTIVSFTAFLLCAPVLLPALLEFKNMIRWVGPFPPVVGNARIPFDAFLTDQLSLSNVANLLVKIKGGSVGDIFSGPLIATLALFALTPKEKSWVVKALIFICVYSFLSAFGSNSGLAYINYHIPFLNKIREPSRFIILFQLGICSLAAIGIDIVSKIQKDDSQKLLNKIAFCMLVTFMLACIATYTERNFIVSQINPWIPVGALFLLSTITFIIKMNNDEKYLKSIPILWGCSVITILFFQVPRVAPNIADSITLSPEVVRLNKVLDRIILLDPKHEYRVIFEGGVDAQKSAMFASYKGIRTLNSYFSPIPYKNFLELYYHGVRSDNYTRVLGAKFLICEKCTEEMIKGYKFIESISGLSIYETKDVLPRVYVSDSVNGNFSSLSDFQLKISSLDLKKAPLFVKQGSSLTLAPKNELNSLNCDYNILIRSSIKIAVNTFCNKEGILVLNEFHDSAWNATINNNKAVVEIVNGNQMGIKLPPGESEVLLNYWPQNFLISCYLFIIGLLLMCYIFLIKRSLHD